MNKFRAFWRRIRRKPKPRLIRKAGLWCCVDDSKMLFGAGATPQEAWRRMKLSDLDFWWT